MNERVLEEAENTKVPPCERLSFAAIYQSNLDEFFMVRVGSLIDQELLGEKESVKNKMTDDGTGADPCNFTACSGIKYEKGYRVHTDYAQLGKYGVRLVDFHKIINLTGEYTTLEDISETSGNRAAFYLHP